VESMTKDSALVLVVAKSEIIKPDQAKPETRSWRMVVHVDQGRIAAQGVKIRVRPVMAKAKVACQEKG